MAETFVCQLDWTGAAAGPTRNVEYSRDVDVTFPGAVIVPMSAAPAFQGDASRVNPEQLFVAALSACQALTYLAMAARSGVQVVRYTDAPEGTLAMADGRMRMTNVTLRPTIVLAPGVDQDKAHRLVEKAHGGCFVANSVSTPVAIEPRFEVAA